MVDTEYIHCAAEFTSTMLLHRLLNVMYHFKDFMSKFS